MNGRPAALAGGKICEEKIACAGELGPNGFYRIKQRAHNFRGGVRPALIAQMITLKLIRKDDTIFEMPLVGTSVRGSECLAILDEKERRDCNNDSQDQGAR
jgi:hypothetical protein